MSIFDFFRRKREQVPVLVSGGDGATHQTAVVVTAPNSRMGIQAEHKYITDTLGEPNVDWTFNSQALIEIDGRRYDVFKVTLKSGEERSIYFDIEGFFGKF